jgi:hypothetical protein
MTDIGWREPLSKQASQSRKKFLSGCSESCIRTLKGKKVILHGKADWSAASSEQFARVNGRRLY